MKTTMNWMLSLLIGSASAVHAAQSAESSGSGILVYLFAGFFALIVVSQLVPAMVLFIGMVKGLFTRSAKKDSAAVRID